MVLNVGGNSDRIVMYYVNRFQLESIWEKHQAISIRLAAVKLSVGAKRIQNLGAVGTYTRVNMETGQICERRS